MSRASVRLRLLVLLLSFLVLAWAGLLSLTYLSARSQVQALFDAQLEQLGRLLLVTTRHENREKDIAVFQQDMQEMHHAYAVAFQVWSGEGELLIASSNAPAAPLSTAPAGFVNTQVEGRAWRVLTLRDPELQYRVQIAGSYRDLGALMLRETRRIVAPVLWSLPLLLLLVWLGVRQGLAPLSRLAAELSRRHHGSLEPLASANLPREVQPLVEEINALFARLEEAFRRYAGFASDVAHELRTPLAGIRTQVQVAQRVKGEAERQRALERILEGVDRAAHHVEQLLALAGTESREGAGELSEQPLGEVVSAAVAELTPRALEKDLDIELHEHGPAPVAGNANLLTLLVRNLVDNAIRYTPAGGKVTVHVGAEDSGHGYLVVEDDGPGIPPEEREKVFDRFYRLPDCAGPGCGLGLSIVRRIADLHGAQVMLDGRAGLPGLAARVRFPPAPARDFLTAPGWRS